MDHYKTPRNQGKLAMPDFSIGLSNPLCGDSITLYGTVENGILKELFFEGEGCIINQAMASILSEKVSEKQLSEIKKISEEEVVSWAGLSLGPNRKQCALLAWQALKQGLNL